MKDHAPLSRGAAFSIAKESWLRHVASFPDLSAADLQFAIVISTFLNSKNRRAWPGLDTMAKLINRNRSTAARSARRLELKQVLGVERHRGRKKSNVYFPLLGGIPKPKKSTLRGRAKMLRARTENVAARQQKGCDAATRLTEEPQSEESRLAFRKEAVVSLRGK